MAKRILTVEDSKTIRQVLGKTLREAGYQVVEATNGEEGLHRMRDETFDLMITDLNMPRMDGITLVREVRRDLGRRFMPILMLTTETQEEQRLAGKAVGASGWLTKPFVPQQLLKVVWMVLS